MAVGQACKLDRSKRLPCWFHWFQLPAHGPKHWEEYKWRRGTGGRWPASPCQFSKRRWDYWCCNPENRKWTLISLFFWFSILSLTFLSTDNIFFCFKHSSLTTKMEKIFVLWRKKFGMIDSRIDFLHNFGKSSGS